MYLGGGDTIAAASRFISIIAFGKSAEKCVCAQWEAGGTDDIDTDVSTP